MITENACLNFHNIKAEKPKIISIRLNMQMESVDDLDICF